MKIRKGNSTMKNGEKSTKKKNLHENITEKDSIIP